MIEIFIREKRRVVPDGTTAGGLRDSFDPASDSVIVNSCPVDTDCVLKEGDRIFFVQGDRIPKAEEPEAPAVSRRSSGVLDKMKKAVVGIAGLGGLGSSVAVALARMGTGTLILADYDVVEPGNLNRQFYFTDQIGMPKTEAMAESLSRINPSVRAVCHREKITEKNLPGIFGKAGVIVECFDRAEEKKMILEAAAVMLPGAFVIGASGVAGYGDSNGIRTWRLSEKTFIVGDLKSAAGPGSQLMAPRVGIAAHHQANLVVSLLVDPGSAVGKIPEII